MSDLNTAKMERRVFGPVPSRRLGKSLGVNNIPYKVCSYSCIYCQLGKAIRVSAERQEFYPPMELVDEAQKLLNNIQDETEIPDYITIVPDGEPTLDKNLGTLIRKMQTLNIPVAVITNSSLLDRPEVKDDLLMADYVSVKTDTFNEHIWKKLNVPHKSLSIEKIIKGLKNFSASFNGILTTETMLIKGINDADAELTNTARMIEELAPEKAFIAIPTRPPAWEKAVSADEKAVARAFHIFQKHIRSVEMLTGYEGDAFASTGHFQEDILSITAVHPMREDAVLKLMHKTEGNEETLNSLLQENLLERVRYEDHFYYLRKFKK